MLLIIAHRGLTEGPDDEKQNRPDQIMSALDQGFDAEIDVWNINGQWFLGHDTPDYQVPAQFLTTPGLWIHCKNIAAFYNAGRMVAPINYFFHNSDLVVLTSKGNVWTYFGPPETRDPSAICVMPEVSYLWTEIEQMAKKKQWLGFCTDWPGKLKSCLE
jgi:hypothetical protein